VAGETSVSDLPPQARKRLAAALLPEVGEEDHQAAAQEQALLDAAAAPPSFDWRSHGGNFVTPARDQGSCGSCWAFAVTAALESQALLANNTADVDLDLSEQVLVSCSNAGSCGGGRVNTASDYIRELGLPLEACFPYTAGDYSCGGACPDWEDTSYHVTGWHWVATTSPTVKGLKKALCLYGPLLTLMKVYTDFYSYQSGVYSRVAGTFVGWHAVLLVGYDDAGQYFVAKNSWGTRWGEEGFFRIDYSQVKNGVFFGDYTIAYEGSGPPGPQAKAFSISPAAKSFKAAGGSGAVKVSAQSGCAWTAASNADWIALTGPDSGTGSGMVSLTVAANPETSRRSGTLTIAGQTFKVKQSGAKKPAP